jgi:hypothetical protein
LNEGKNLPFENDLSGGSIKNATLIYFINRCPSRPLLTFPIIISYKIELGGLKSVGFVENFRFLATVAKIGVNFSRHV